MALTVAFAVENDAYDGAIYCALLARVFGAEVTPWRNPMRFSGANSLRTQGPLFVKLAVAASVKHVLFAVDNDGGARRHPEHEDVHDPKSQVQDPGGCRTCHVEMWLASAVQEHRVRPCIVVPVQTLETWLLVAQGEPPPPTPEQYYDRGALKKRVFGKPTPALETRVRRATGCLEAPGAMERLRERPSFRRFETQVDLWRTLAS